MWSIAPWKRVMIIRTPDFEMRDRILVLAVAWLWKKTLTIASANARLAST